MGRKLRDFKCEKCDYAFEALVDDEEAPQCPKCTDSEYVTRGFSGFGSYSIGGDNSASVRPKMAGYKPKAGA